MAITTFTLKDHPMDWPSAIQTLIFLQVVEYVRVSIEAISERETGVAKLLLSIFWSRIMKDELRSLADEADVLTQTSELSFAFDCKVILSF
jgi:hypothetical protein